MSTSTPNEGGGGGNAPRRRELVFCHECEDEWFRDESGLVCPRCGSDFVEIVCSPFFPPLPKTNHKTPAYPTTNSWSGQLALENNYY